MAKLDELVNSVPGLTVCRFDVKYESIEELKNGVSKPLLSFLFLVFCSLLYLDLILDI